MGFCDSSQSSSAPPVWADPLGPSSLKKNGNAVYGTSGAPQIRSDLFSYMRGLAPYTEGAAAAYAPSVGAGMASPGWAAGQKLATETMAGNYLHGSPELNAAEAANTSRTMASAADADARLKSMYAKNGMSFSTGAQQASEANRASAAADAGRTNATMGYQNYAMERANQNAAPGMFQSTMAAPLSYLSNASQNLLAPATTQGNLLSALSSGGQVITPNTSQSINPSLGSNIVNGWAGVMGNL